MLALIAMIMNRFRYILVVLLTLISTSCSFYSPDVKEEDYVSVSMEYDGTYLGESIPGNTRSQFYLRKHSFSYYILAYFPQGSKALRILISSGEGFELNKWYNLPSAETDDIWESFALIRYDGNLHKADEKAIAGRVMFTKLEQKGNLSYSGEGHCTIEGEFEITLENKESPENSIEIKNGKFYILRSNYWDSRAMED